MELHQCTSYDMALVISLLWHGTLLLHNHVNWQHTICEYYIMYTHICSTHLCHYSRLGGLHRSIWEPFVPNTTSLFTHLWSTYLETSRVHDVHHCQLFIKEPCHVQTIYLVQFILSVHKIPQSLSTLVHDLKDQTGSYINGMEIC
jgi:hypothetical protein